MADHIWTIKGGGALGPAPFFVMGIVNVTPDSFYDGGRHYHDQHGMPDPAPALAHGRELFASGADILDVGGESTRPYAQEVPEALELARVLPVVGGLAGLEYEGRTAHVSVDTYKACVAAQALEAGAGIVNDVSACRFDPGLADVLAQYRPGYVLMHSPKRPDRMQDDPSYTDVVAEIMNFFEERMAALVASGVPESSIVLDPGIGFGKLLEHNLEILRNIERFSTLGRPLLVGLSNKSLWGNLLGLDVDQRQTATQVATALMAARGVAVHRVHEAASTVRTLRMVRELAAVGGSL